MRDSAVCVQLRCEVIMMAEYCGHTLLWDKTKVWQLPNSGDVYVSYRVFDGRRGIIKIPYEDIFERRGEIMARHFPARWEDPVH